MSEVEIGLSCYFCHQGIASEGLDPCGITFSVRWPSEDDAGWQQLFCHFECFAQYDNPDFPLLRHYE
jgi:hypothetical protein